MWFNLDALSKLDVGDKDGEVGLVLEFGLKLIPNSGAEPEWSGPAILDDLERSNGDMPWLLANIYADAANRADDGNPVDLLAQCWEDVILWWAWSCAAKAGKAAIKVGE